MQWETEDVGTMSDCGGARGVIRMTAGSDSQQTSALDVTAALQDARWPQEGNCLSDTTERAAAGGGP